MKCSFFQAMALVAASAFALPLFAQPARADGSIILRSTPSFDLCAHAATLPLYGRWVDEKPMSYIITNASDVNAARRLGVVFPSYLASIGKGPTQHVATLGDRYVFEGGPDFSQQRSYEASTGGFQPESFNPRCVGDTYSPFASVGGIAGVLDEPMFAPDGERPYARNRYSPLLNKEVLPAENAPRVTDFAMFAGAKPAGFLVNYPYMIRIIRL